MFHLVDGPRAGLPRVPAELTPRLALAEQIPALVELSFDLGPALLPLGRGLAISGQLVFFAHEFLDPRQDVVVHGASMRLAR